jgi:hypothetical protein
MAGANMPYVKKSNSIVGYSQDLMYAPLLRAAVPPIAAPCFAPAEIRCVAPIGRMRPHGDRSVTRRGCCSYAEHMAFRSFFTALA